jgi:hypothetical protein
VKRRSLAIVAGAAAAALVSLVFVSRARAKPTTEFQILTGYAAKETCSCVFVVQQDDTFCTAFGQIQGYTTDIAIDHTGNGVTATFTGTSARSAHYTDAAGCTLDPLP